MDDLIPEDRARTDVERYVVSGWSALEAGDLAGARAALQDLYTADPTHPALPLLAAGIRRARPKPVPWRAAIFAVALVAVGVYGVSSWRLHDRPAPEDQHKAATTEVSTLQQSAAPTPSEVPSEMGTVGQVQPPTLPTAKQNASSLPVDEDVVVRQAIQRFEGAYQNRWGALAFSHCDVSRELDSAIATCQPRPTADTPDQETDQVWTFSLRKADGGWKIASVQPPPNKER